MQKSLPIQDRPEPSAATTLATQYDTFATDYVHARAAYYAANPNPSSEVLYDALRGKIRGKKVLDAGCGAGGDLQFLSDEGADVYGIDPSEKMLEIAKRDYPWAKEDLRIGTCESTGAPSGFFDGIFSKYAIHYAEDPAAVFAEFSRITKSGALLALTIGHPIMQLLLKHGGTYGDTRVVEMPLMDTKISALSPSHTFAEYFSPIFFTHFELLAFYEGPVGQMPNGSPWRVPFFFSVILRKKLSLPARLLRHITGRAR